jgi:hypothetical protein
MIGQGRAPGSEPGLAEVLGFSGDELAANRAGELSDRQLARLRESRARQRTTSGGRTRTVAITAAIVAVLVAAAVVPRLAGSHGRSAADIPYLVAAVILIGLLMWRSAARAGTSVSRLTGGVVNQAEGVAKVRRPGAGAEAAGPAGEARCELSIGGTRFLVSAAVLAAFADDRAYRAYYVGDGPKATIVSAERL